LRRPLPKSPLPFILTALNKIAKFSKFIADILNTLDLSMQETADITNAYFLMAL